MRIRTMGYLIGEAAGSVRDNGLLSVAAVSTVAISLLVLAMIALLAANMQNLARTVDGQVQIVAYLGSATAAGASGSAASPAQGASSASVAPAPSSSADASGASASGAPAATSASGTAAASASAPAAAEQPDAALVQQIRALPHVTEAVLVSKAQSLAALQKDLGAQANLLGQFQQDNPLPDSVQIHVDSPTNVAAVVAELDQMSGVSRVQNAQGAVDKLVGFTRAVRILGVFLVAALALATVVVIGNTVRVAVWARRDQIAVMKLVGATDSFIRWPFFVEGAILGLIGAAVAGGVVAWGYTWLHRVVTRSMAFLPLLGTHTTLPVLVEGLMAGGILLGALGSAVSVHRHLDV